MPAASIIHFDRLIAHKKFYEPGEHMPWHRDKLSRISITIDGSWEERTENNIASVNSSSLLIKPKEAYHETTFGKKGCTILSVQFADDSLFPASFGEWNCYSHPGLSLAGLKLWASLKKVRTEKEVSQLFESLLSTVGTLQQQKIPNTLLQKAEQLLVDVEDRKNVQAVSDAVRLHRGYLSRAFKKNYLCAPSVYAKQTRLLKAVGYLSLPGMSLTRAAYSAEYADQSHMNRSIKKEFGCTPSQLRKCIL
jgi:AraC-like DNA-binding protein